MKSVIVGLARTPIGRFGGGLRPLRATELGAAAIRGALDCASVPAEAVDEVIFGHVVQAGAGQITARQAASGAGIPMTVPATTINKVCLSGLTAIAMADRSIRLDEGNVIVAGGMESMSNAPFILPDARWGGRLGHSPLVDAMQHDGLWCAFDECSMGEAADAKNDALGISREEQDQWSLCSHQRAACARDSGHFANEIVAVDVPARRGQTVRIEHDEGIRDTLTAESLAGLRPVFTPEGSTTPGNASQISDGGAAVIVASERAAADLGAEPIAEVVSYGQIAGPDATLHERPAQAINAALDRAGLKASDLDVVEINEAFASVALWSARMLDLDPACVNPNGGAVALGHPLGATGARLMVTLLNELRRRGGGLGAASLCGGGGQGDAVIVRVG